MAQTARITVHGDRPYDVVIGRGVISQVAAVVPDRAERVAVLHAPSVQPLVADAVDALARSGRLVSVIELPDAEAAKDVDVLSDCWRRLGEAGFTRSDAVVGIGGGATTDLAGFVGASWLRGVDVVLVPTTTLAMVDAAVGGKTGINTAHGKNLVGAFHPPVAVVCDLDVLATLPLDDHRAGLAEVVKAGFIADPVILDLIEADPASALDPAAEVLAELVVRAVEVKAAVVGADLREQATGGVSREWLNYGHTFAHAIEVVEGYRWRHGDAVAVGMVFVAELARLVGRIDGDLVVRHRATLGALGLPVSYGGHQWESLLAAMRIDKKARGSVLRFVLLDALAQPVVVPSPDDDTLHEAFLRVTQ